MITVTGVVSPGLVEAATIRNTATLTGEVPEDEYGHNRCSVSVLVGGTRNAYLPLVIRE